MYRDGAGSQSSVSLRGGTRSCANDPAHQVDGRSRCSHRPCVSQRCDDRGRVAVLGMEDVDRMPPR